MFRLCRFDQHVLFIEEAQKVAGNRQASVRYLRVVPRTFQIQFLLIYFLLLK
jgi:hypothetical protein